MTEKKDLVGLIKEAGRTQRVNEFECPYVDGFYVKLAYASKFILNQIREVAREVAFTRTGAREERLNEKKIREHYVRYVIKGWHGLTVGKLRKLLPSLEISGDDENKEVPFSPEIAEALLEYSLEFDNWVASVSGELSNFASPEQKEKEFENLE